MDRLVYILCIISSVLVGPTAAQELQYNQEKAAKKGAFVVLKNGQTFRPEKAIISDGNITLHFRNGATKIYSINAVHFDESSGIRKTLVKKNQSGKGSLSGIAGSIKLTKSAMGPDEKIVIIGNSAVPPSESHADTSASPENTSAPSDDPSEGLRQSASQLGSSWRQYQSLKGQVSRNCTGDEQFWSDGKQYSGPANQSLACRQVVKRARSKLSQCRSQYKTLVNEARRNNVLPGTLRTAISSLGSTNFLKTLSSEEEFLDTTMKPSGRRYFYDGHRGVVG